MEEDPPSCQRHCSFTPSAGGWPERKIAKFGLRVLSFDTQGRSLYVIGANQNQPEDGRIAGENATWLRWFGPLAEALSDNAKPNGNLILRNMLPEESFANAIQNIPVVQSNADARATMGSTTPMRLLQRSLRSPAECYQPRYSTSRRSLNAATPSWKS